MNTQIPLNKDSEDYIQTWLERIKTNIGDDFALKEIVNKIYEEGFEDGVNG